MTRRDKLRKKIAARPAHVRVSDIEALLNAEGWTLARRKGSHRAFTKPGHPTLIIPIDDGKVGRVYLDAICAELGLDDQG